jgi:SAM-dependent methyltransferase
MLPVESSETAACPVCESDNCREIYPKFVGHCVTSDMSVLPGATIDNRICGSCGFIFNAGGTRGVSSEFYRRSYRLRMHTPAAKSMTFSSGRLAPFAGALLDFFAGLDELGAARTFLEIGAGKGDFLAAFALRFPHIALTAIEPSASSEILAARVRSAIVHPGPYHTFGRTAARFDAIAALGVLEHVEAPLTLLDWTRARLAADGVLLISVPDFLVNPNDLFCIDHLSKITPSSLEMLASWSGFDVVKTTRIGIACVAILRPNKGPCRSLSALGDNAVAVEKNEALARQNIEAVLTARTKAREEGVAFGVFGLGASGIFAPLYGGFPHEEIAAYIDENPTMHGASIAGRPVIGLEELARVGIRHVSLAVSPIYRNLICEKLSRYGVIVHG